MRTLNVAPPPLIPTATNPDHRAAEEYAAGRGFQGVRPLSPGFWVCLDIDGDGNVTPLGGAFEVRDGKVVGK